MAAARPLVTIQNADGTVASQVSVPEIFLAPIRTDIVRRVHNAVNKNRRQAHGVKYNAGAQTSAESWGTGRAVSRIPRVRGGGTHRSGQGAFGNMCRGGRMYNPKRIWRKWHQTVTVAHRRFAITSALAASAVTPLVMARGHRINDVAEIPLVISDAAAANVVKTKQAVQLFKQIGAYTDVEKAIHSKKIRAGKGKLRNRRYRQKLGPLIIYGSKTPLILASRNLPGVSSCNVNSLNILKLAPGGHIGRFCVWTESAFNQLDRLYGTESKKKGYKFPRAKMTNPDVDRIINSEEVKAVTRPERYVLDKRPAIKRNPLKNREHMMQLNPYLKQQRKDCKKQKTDEQRKAARAAKRAAATESRKKRVALYASLRTVIGRNDQH